MFFPLWLFFIYYLMYFPYIELRYHSPILKDEKNICSISVEIVLEIALFPNVVSSDTPRRTVQ